MNEDISVAVLNEKEIAVPMFGALEKFLDTSYLMNHVSGTLYIDEEPYELVPFATIEAEATDEYIFAPTTKSKEEVLAYVVDNARCINQEVMKDHEDNLLFAMSTCKYPDTIDRTIVFCYLKRYK